MRGTAALSCESSELSSSSDETETAGLVRVRVGVRVRGSEPSVENRPAPTSASRRSGGLF